MICMFILVEVSNKKHLSNHPKKFRKYFNFPSVSYRKTKEQRKNLFHIQLNINYRKSSKSRKNNSSSLPNLTFYKFYIFVQIVQIFPLKLDTQKFQFNVTTIIPQFSYIRVPTNEQHFLLSFCSVSTLTQFSKTNIILNPATFSLISTKSCSISLH